MEERDFTPGYPGVPHVFLIHHFLELELKEVIRATFSIGTMEGNESVESPPISHDLTRLLALADSNLEKLGLGEAMSISRETRDIMEDLERFSSRGEAFRYPTSGEKKPLLPKQYIADVASLMKIMDKTLKECLGITAELVGREECLEFEPDADGRHQ